jgi:molecular chaperone GrpE
MTPHSHQDPKSPIELEETKQLEVEESSQAQQADQLLKLAANYEAVLEREKRVIADYQNLVRRSQEDRVKFVKLASSDFALSLLQPLDHLALAAAQLKDQGLDMVMNELWMILKDQGLEEITVMGEPFDVSAMEVVEKQGKAEKVVAVVSRGYRLNGEVIRHAKVVLG